MYDEKLRKDTVAERKLTLNTNPSIEGGTSSSRRTDPAITFLWQILSEY